MTGDWMNDSYNSSGADESKNQKTCGEHIDANQMRKGRGLRVIKDAAVYTDTAGIAAGQHDLQLMNPALSVGLQFQLAIWVILRFERIRA